MLNKIVQHIKHHIYDIALFLIVSTLFVANVKPNTFLTGWDSLQTDLYPWLGVKRAFFAVWQEYQSFGLVGGMGHASDLVRAFFIFIVSFVLPQNLIRYFFHFLMLLLGGLGILRLLRLTRRDTHTNIVDFIGASFYMLNLGTVQMFSVPFEPFSVFFGFLPWEIWIFIKTLQKNKSGKKDLMLFIIINLLATPQAYVQTLFVVYLFILGCITLGMLLQNNILSTLKRSIILLLIILFINLFWLLPQLYFLKTSGRTVEAAKINQLSTENVYFQNKEKGTLQHFLKMDGFYFDLFDIKQQPLFSSWRAYLNKPFLATLPYFFASIAILGFVTAIKEKKKYLFSFLFCLILVGLGLLNGTIPFSWLNDLLRKNELLNQIFRSPFTKFIIPYSLIMSYFITQGLNFIFDRFTDSKKKYIILSVFFAVLIFILSFPSFKGNLISPTMKVQIPSEYLELMNYFKHEDKNKRIALLPDYTFWGWFYNKWGYNGSGFFWYGIEQPIISRTFDVWSDKSEGYFWQIKTAIEAENLNKFESTLDKYKVDFFILDYTLLPASSTIKGLQYDRIETILTQSKKVTLVKKWKNIVLYKVNQKQNIKNFISVGSSLPNLGPQANIVNDDNIFQDNSDYQTNISLVFQMYYPFLNLTSQTNIPNRSWDIKDTGKDLRVTAKLDDSIKGYKISTPSASTLTLYKDDNIITIKNTSQVKIKNNNLHVQIPKNTITAFNPSETQVNNCNFPQGKVDKKSAKEKVTVTSQNKAIACFGYDAPYLDQRYGYLIKIKNKNIKGRRLFFYILDKTKKQSYIESRLTQDEEYFILSPRYQYGLGYSFIFNEESYENISSSNELSEITIFTFPYDELKNIKLIKDKTVVKPINFSSHFSSMKKSYFLYTINIQQKEVESNTITLYQSFHPGWKAYLIKSKAGTIEQYLPFLFGQEIKEHIIINNWANGWALLQGSMPQGETIVIIFWPQYLEFIGFILLSICLILILRRNYKLD